MVKFVRKALGGKHQALVLNTALLVVKYVLVVYKYKI